MADTSELYNEVRLQTPDSIRVLEILPGRHAKPVSVVLRAVCLNTSPQYEALSYTWGAVSDKNVRIQERYDILVTDNLYHALLRLRHKSQIRTMWVDAICINQSDVEERSRQVAMMGRICREATCVNAWLGEPGRFTWRLQSMSCHYFRQASGTLLCFESGIGLP